MKRVLDHQEKLDAAVEDPFFARTRTHVTIAGICHQSKRASLFGRPFMMMIYRRRIICVAIVHLVEYIKRLDLAGFGEYHKLVACTESFLWWHRSSLFLDFFRCFCLWS